MGKFFLLTGTGNVSDPHRFYADPDPAFLLNADPDSTCIIYGFLTAANFWFN
jgi:hypothetical protein